MAAARRDRTRTQLRDACIAGDQKRVEALLRPQQSWYERILAHWCFRAAGSADEPDPKVMLDVLLPPFVDDDNNTILHYVLSGSPLNWFGKLLWATSSSAASDEIQPGRVDNLRSQIAAWLLTKYPALLSLLCCRNAAGFTPLHCGLKSASTETLQVLLGKVNLLRSAFQRISLSMPGPQGQTALDMAVQTYQWEAVQLLIVMKAHILTHDFLAASQEMSLLLNPPASASHGGLASKVFTNKGNKLVNAVSGVVKSYFGQLLDLVTGQAQEREVVLQHLQAVQQGEHVCVGHSMLSRSGSTVFPVGGASSSAAGSEGVMVLQGMADVERLRREQIESTAYVLGVSGPEAAALLAQHGWDELAAMQSRLGDNTGDSRRQSNADACSRGSEPGGAGSGGAFSVRSDSVLDGLIVGGSSRLPAPSTGGALAVVLSGFQQPAAATDPIGDSSQGVAAARAAAASSAAGMSNEEARSPPSEDNSHSQTAPLCIVCYEACGGVGAWQHLPCGHRTCDACWEGILQAQLDTGEVHRVVCPQPGCGMPLPAEAAEKLLSHHKYQRYEQLLAQSYVASNPNLHWCPRPGCGNVVCLVGQQGSAAGTEQPSLRAAAAAGRGITVHCACGHSFCWACSADAHEPATCDQMRRWQEELLSLRQAVLDQNQQWIARNTKRCPSCSAPIQKQGGCNHMTCRACRHQWCWECGRGWGQHNAETGGYYHCILDRRSDLPDFEEPSSSGALGWLRETWGAIQSMTAKHAVQQYLHQFLRHDFNPAQLATLATHTQRLLLAVGVVGTGAYCQPCHSAAAAPEGTPGIGSPSTGCRNGYHRGFTSGSWEKVAPRGSKADVELDPSTLLGLTLGEVAAMGKEEWGQLVIATADSMADAGQMAAVATGEGACGADVADSGRGCDDCGAVDLAHLARQVTSAHSVLQHAQVAGWALGGYGVRRRFLAKLCEGIEERVGRLEGLLMGMPDREAALQCQQQQFKAPSVWAAGGRKVTSLPGQMLLALFGVHPPLLGSPGQTASDQGCQQEEEEEEQVASHQVKLPAHQEQPIAQCCQHCQCHHQQEDRQWVQENLTRGLHGQQLRRQVYYALALSQQSHQLGAELAALEAGVRELVQAGRAGLFAG